MGAHKYYTVNENKITRTKPFCPKCGTGIFLAEHADRMTCGRCGYTKYSKK